jgi:hypothetical protein
VYINIQFSTTEKRFPSDFQVLFYRFSSYNFL